jgi:hypothetical protein
LEWVCRTNNTITVFSTPVKKRVPRPSFPSKRPSVQCSLLEFLAFLQDPENKNTCSSFHCRDNFFKCFEFDIPVGGNRNLLGACLERRAWVVIMTFKALSGRPSSSSWKKADLGNTQMVDCLNSWLKAWCSSWRLPHHVSSPSIVHLFSSVAHVLGTWSKNYWADCRIVWFFFNLIFMSVRILNFYAIHSVIKKMFHKGPLPIYGTCQKWRILFLDMFQQNLVYLYRGQGSEDKEW